MPSIANLVQDSQLSRGSYTSNNSGSSLAINGSQPIALQWGPGYAPPATFGAQLYKNADGSYTIAFRGTEGNFADWAANGAYMANEWHPEWEAATRFTALALEHIRAEDPSRSFGESRNLLRVTGHSQGGFLAELQARLFGLKGSSLDGMGAEGLYNTHRDRLAAVVAEQGVALDPAGYGVTDFTSRVYTAIGLMGTHSTNDVEYSPLYNTAALLIGLGAGPLPSALFQGLVHGIDNIVEIEKARAENAFLRLITHDDTSGTLGIEAARMAEGLVGGPVLVAGNGTLVGLNEANLPLTEELRDTLVTFGAGTAIFRQSDGAVYLESADGRRGLLRRTDGSGFEWGPDASGNATVALVREPGGVTRRIETRGNEVEVSDMGGNVERRRFEIGSNGLPRLTGVETSGYIGSTHVTVTRDGAGTVLATRRVAMDGEGHFVDHTVRQDGSETRITRDVNGFEIRRTDIPSYAQTLASGVQDATALINAIKSGKPLPQFASGLKLLNTLDREHALPYLGTASTVAQGVLSIYNLANAFEHGDALDQISAAGNAIVAVDRALQTVVDLPALSSVADSIGPALQGLGLIAAVKNDDPIGAAMSIGTMIEGSAFLSTNPIGWVLLAASFVKAMQSPPEAWGVGSFKFGESTTLAFDVQGESFGVDRVSFVMLGNGEPERLPDGTDNPDYFGGVRGYLDKVIEAAQQRDPNHPLGIIPQRLGTLTWREARLADAGYSLRDPDPVTGQESLDFLRYNDDLTPYNADPTVEAQRLNLLKRMVVSAIDREAIAPMWEVNTARLQQDIGDPNAGLTEEVRAARRGQLAPIDPETDAPTAGAFRPIALDLDGDGRITTVADADNDRALNWDGAGFDKQVGWVGAGEGLLWLDRNPNGVVDSGKELFSNSAVADAAKGIRSLSWVDANADGVIAANEGVLREAA